MASYIDQISSLDPKIWFKFNETAGTPTNSGSLSCSLTATGTPLLNSDSSVDGRSIYLNGSSHYTLSNLPAFSVFDDRSFSIEGWFKVPTVGTVWQYPVLLRDSAFDTSYVFCRILGTTAASSVIGKLEFTFKPGSGYSPYTVYSTSRVDDNKWHHFVMTVNTTSMKLYIDGGLVGSTGISTPASINFDGSNTIKTIGESIVGNIDEIAVYPVELTSSQINANYVAGNAVYATPDVMTASGTFPMTVSQTIINFAPTPMTASAEAGDALQNDLDLPQSLNTYMSTLSLEQWYKFDEYRKITNYGTGGTSAWSFYGTTDSEFNGGVQGSGAIKFTGNSANGLISGYGTSPAVINPELTDGDFSIGFWFKKGNIDDNANLFQATNFTNYIDITFNALGEVDANYHSNQDHVLNTGVDVTDNEWHFLVFRLSGTSLALYLDGTSVDTTTVNNTFTTALTDYAFGQGNNGSDTIYMSQFFIATAANVQGTQISNMWTYGNLKYQAGASMITPVISFNNAFNNFVQSKTPYFDLRMDEASGAPANYTSQALSLAATASNYTQGVSSRNRYAYNFTNRDTKFEGAWSSPTGTFTANQKQTLAVFAKMSTISAAAGIASTGSTGGNFGVGLTLICLANTGYIRLRINSTTSLYDQIDTTTSYADNNYHLFVAVKDGSTLKLYIDGKEVGSTTSSYNITDSGTFTIAGQPNATPSGARSLTVDEVSVFDRAFTAEEAFNMWQSISLEMDTTASSTIVMPAISVGTGPTITASPMTASSNMEKPTQFSNHMEAFGLFQMPNFGATVNLDANYGSEPLTASAEFHMPQYNIGDGHTADHMDASVTFVDPIVSTPGNVNVNPVIAQDATFVMPGIVTIKGARIFAETLTVRAFFPLPPAYFQLEDDLYYVRLFKQHSVINREDLNSTGLEGVKKSNLHFFNDVTEDITIRSGRFLTDELPAYVFDEPGTIYQDENGNTIQAPATKRQYAPSGNPLSTPTPMLSKGYFDNQQRSAVRLDNIEFPFDKSNSVDIFKPFSLEFTIKTTKANQIIALGRWESFLNYQRRTSTIGLFNGKLYGMDTFQQIGGAQKVPHPSTLKDLGDLSTGYILSNKRIDDGEWHHIVYQYDLLEERTQIWIDGVLDRQILGITSSVPGSNGYAYVRPYVMGFNDATGTLGSDFQTSVWSYDPGPIVSRDNIGLNFVAYQKSEPIKAEVMTASITTAMPLVKGNRARALMLYFWSTITPGYDDLATRYVRQTYSGESNSGARYTPFDGDTRAETNDRDTFFPISTWEQGSQKLYDWDVFPVDVQGFYTSRVVKEESYKNPLEHGTVNGRSQGFRDEFDRRRYIDLEKDIIDLDSFDMICFRNYPNESAELDAFSRNEVVDQYFDLRESETFQSFLKSIRRAVDKGMSLFITNPQLAIDLGIIDNYEPVSELIDTGADYTDSNGDPWSRLRTDSDVWTITNPTANDIPIGYDKGSYTDLYKNNRHRVLNTLTGLTDEPSYVKTEEVEYISNDELDFGGFNRRWVAVQEKPNGLTVGDEFMFSSIKPFYIGVPLTNIKAGRAITTFGSAYRAGVINTQNPYVNYATTIAVRPGDVLNGTQVGGKIFVNLTEWIQDQDEFEEVELITPYWINKAVADGTIDEVTAAEYRTRTQYLPTPTSFQSHWSLNGDNITGSVVYYGAAAQKITVYSTASGAVRTSRKTVTRSGRRRGRDTGTAGDAFMSYRPEWGFVNPTMQVRCLDMTSRGLIWLSERELYGVIPQRPLAITVDAEMVNPTVTADKDRVVYSEAMVANATTPEIGTVPNRLQLSLPMYAQARITDVTKAYYPEPYTTTAFMPQNVKVTSFDVDQVVLYIMHADAELYIREEVIK